MPVDGVGRLLPLLGIGVGEARDELRIPQLVERRLGAVDDEHRLAAPHHDDLLPRLQLTEVDVDRLTGGHRGSVGIHLINQRPYRRGDADGADRARRKVEKIAAGSDSRLSVHDASLAMFNPLQRPRAMEI